MDKIVEIGAGSEASLECINLSYIRSFTTGNWYTKLFNPPITAQFLKDVGMELRGGEVMGVMGASGSGKTTLLNVIARRVQGTTGGGILLNRRPMTEREFHASAAYVSMRQPLLPFLSVRQSLAYACELGLAVGRLERDERVGELLRDFELRELASRRVHQLKESARRRLLLASALARDPQLLLVDEPTRDLAPLAAYQLMHCLYQYIKRTQRLAVVATSAPRSDIYQLFDRLSLLFFGEVLYSGYTRRMPAYFRSLGFPCPPGENPAIFYLALATVDRETSERYLETQDTAVKLIELFKTSPGRLLAAQRPANAALAPLPFNLPLCSLGPPSIGRRLWSLVKRNYACLWHQKVEGLGGRLLALPILAAILVCLYWDLGSDQSEEALESRAGLLYNLQLATAFTAVLVAKASLGGAQRRRFHQERWDGLYGGGLFVASQWLSSTPLLLLSSAASAAIIHFGAGLGKGTSFVWAGAINLSLTAVLIAAIWSFAEGLLLMTLLFVRDAFAAATAVASLLSLAALPYAGYARSYATLGGGEGRSTDWLYFLSYASPFRHAGLLLNHGHLANATGLACPSGLCRWGSGRRFLLSVYEARDVDGLGVGEGGFWTALGVAAGLGALAQTAALLLYALPMPHFLKRKFRYK